MHNQVGFVLRTVKYSESDLILHILTKEGQKLQLFARAALKSKKRFGGGVLEPTHLISASFSLKKSEEGLGTLNEASLIQSFDGLRVSYDRLQVALLFVSWIDKLSPEGMDDSKLLYDLLGHSLKSLETAKDCEVLKTQFMLKLLSLQGVMPQMAGAEILLSKSVREVNDILIERDQQNFLSRQAEALLEQYLGR